MFAKNINKSEILSDLKTKGYCAIESFITPEVIKEIENEVTKNRYSLNENIQNGIYYETQYYFILKHKFFPLDILLHLHQHNIFFS